ncbi:MAG: GAF domain-containing protein [Actinobacteria bacterium]|nr:GAF domain-containing protein [Actinomycetota bacterium]
MAQDSANTTELQHLLDAIVAVGSELSLPLVLRRIVETATGLVGARYGALGVLDETHTRLSEFLTTGMDGSTVETIGTPPSGHGILGLLIVDPRPIRLPDLTAHPDSYGFPPGHPPMESFLGVPIRVRGQVFGNLYLTEKTNGSEFTDADLEFAEALASVAGVAVENARLHSRVGELRVVEDRERIARDLHDTVIQRLFATGLALQSLAARAGDAEVVDRLQQVVEDLDDTVRRIRTTIFELQRPRIPGRSIRQEVLDLVSETLEHTEIEPSVRFDGAVDLTIPETVADHLVAVVRESVSNVVRHSGASKLVVDITVNDHVEVRVIDNGRGLSPESSADSRGLHNLRSRAHELGGDMTLEKTPGGGTTLVWRVPLPG